MALKPSLSLLAVVVIIGDLWSVSAARKAGGMLTYEMVSRSDVSGGGRKNPYAGQPGVTNFKITVTSVDAEENAVVHVVVEDAFPESLAHSRYAAASLKEWEAQSRYKQFDATLSREGSLLVAVDNSLPEDSSTGGQSLPKFRDAVVAEVHSPEYQAKLAQNQVAGAFALPNAVALSCAKRSSLSQGDSWRVASKADGATYDVLLSGKQSYRGHNVLVLSAKYHLDSPNGSSDTEATIYYDLEARLIVGAHSATQNEIRVTSMKTLATTDLNLKE
jgi:hypothetical protein